MLILFARSRGGVRAVALLILVTVAATQVPVELVDLRFRAARVGLAPLLSAASGVLVPVMCTRPEGALEPLRSPRLRLVRGAWLAIVGSSTWSVGVVAFHGQPGGGVVSARNVALSAGLGLLFARRLAPPMAWCPSGLVVALTAADGTMSWSGHPYAWALLLEPASSATAMVVALALGGGGALGYVLWDTTA